MLIPSTTESMESKIMPSQVKAVPTGIENLAPILFYILIVFPLIADLLRL